MKSARRNSTNLAVLILGMSLAIVFLLGAGDESHPSTSGRFQLFEGDVDAIVVAPTAVDGPIRHILEHEIIRLDTATGQTWSLDVGADSGHYHKEWYAIRVIGTNSP